MFIKEKKSVFKIILRENNHTKLKEEDQGKEVWSDALFSSLELFAPCLIHGLERSLQFIT